MSDKNTTPNKAVTPKLEQRGFTMPKMQQSANSNPKNTSTPTSNSNTNKK